ncbi:MAG: SIMPL domain-containing protein [Proteobacteria bacterium]|nr:SIMPL domain-containing protein [Pseudomonadota bacterium]MBI3499147.1 SIMPL domain-containing protein [Pseudomonadota bacterium]
MSTRILTIAVLCLMTSAAAAQTAPQADDGAVVLRLSESAVRQVTQDRLRASLRVEVGGADARSVQGQVNAKMAAALEKAKAVAGLRVETAGYYVYEDRTLRRGQRWWGNQGLTLIGSDAAALLALAGQLQDDGLVMGGLAYELAPETRRRIEGELIPEAIQKLREKAETTAHALGLTHLRFREVRLGDVAAPRLQPLGLATVMAADRTQPMAPPAAEPGETPVAVQVEAEVQLRP